MKKFLLSITLSLVSIPMFSQIQNGSFETWTSSGVYPEEPADWTTSNFGYYFFDQFESALSGTTITHPASAVKDPNAPQQGTYALKLLNVTGNDGTAVPTDTLPGFAIQGIKTTVRPTGLTGYYKFNQGAPGNSPTLDTALIGIAITKYNSTTKLRDTIGQGTMEIFTSKATYAAFTVPVTYKNGTTGDSIFIILASSDTDKNFPATTFTIDNVSLAGVTGINMPLASVDPVYAYPNPSSTDIYLKDLPKGTTKVEIKDLSGRILKVIHVSSDFVNFNITDLSSGMYYYSLTSEEGAILYTGKFDVKN